MYPATTIAAVATAGGPGAIGIIRVSGAHSAQIIRLVAERVPTPRYASLQRMFNPQGQTIDRGLVLFFAGPASYTGEDMAEFHTHGGPAVLAQTLQAIYAAGAAPARPGEFTERAFLNGKLDLLQAEAVADLITASSEQGLRSANLAIAGHFSGVINEIKRSLQETRARLEATIDFSDEASVNADVSALFPATAKLANRIQSLLESARQGARLAHGVRVILMGPPNAGKSTLMNALSGQNRAIVSARPGTTRDVLSSEILLEGIALTLVDTAGLHETTEEIEQEGIRRALHEATTADLILVLYDAATERPALSAWLAADEIGRIPVMYVRNKIDLISEATGIRELDGIAEVSLSARERKGLDVLRTAIRQALSIDVEMDSPLLARARHLQALTTALDLLSFSSAPDFADDPVESAERLRLAHQALGELTGEFTSEDLLGEIFARFCIGK